MPAPCLGHKGTLFRPNKQIKNKTKARTPVESLGSVVWTQLREGQAGNRRELVSSSSNQLELGDQVTWLTLLVLICDDFSVVK